MRDEVLDANKLLFFIRHCILITSPFSADDRGGEGVSWSG